MITTTPEFPTNWKIDTLADIRLVLRLPAAQQVIACQRAREQNTAEYGLDRYVLTLFSAILGCNKLDERSAAQLLEAITDELGDPRPKGQRGEDFDRPVRAYRWAMLGLRLSQKDMDQSLVPTLIGHFWGRMVRCGWEFTQISLKNPPSGKRGPRAVLTVSDATHLFIHPIESTRGDALEHGERVIVPRYPKAHLKKIGGNRRLRLSHFEYEMHPARPVSEAMRQAPGRDY